MHDDEVLGFTRAEWEAAYRHRESDGHSDPAAEVDALFALARQAESDAGSAHDGEAELGLDIADFVLLTRVSASCARRANAVVDEWLALLPAPDREELLQLHPELRPEAREWPEERNAHDVA